MANADFREFYYYFKYDWSETDFANFQTWMRDRFAGIFEGLLGQAVLSGLNVTADGSDRILTVKAGLAVTPSGRLMVLANDTTVTPASPAGNPARTLIVLRPVDTDETLIPTPTNPAVNVPLHKALLCSVVVLDGTPGSSPAYPAVTTGDVILCGVRLAASASSIASTDLDLGRRDILGKNSVLFGAGSQSGDPRISPYISSLGVLGIKPSQTFAPTPKLYSYVGGSKASLFPKTAGAISSTDATYNFKTGVIGGGDATTSSPFAASVPTSGNYIWALVSLTSSDLIVVQYGTQGTYAQCKANLANLVSSGAGSVPTTSNFRVALVLVGSSDGVNVTDMEVVDARGPIGANPPQSSVDSITTDTTGSYTIASSDTFREADATSGDVNYTLPDRASNVGRKVTIARIDASANKARVSRAGSDTILSSVSTTFYDLDDAYQTATFEAGNSAWIVVNK